LEVKKDILWRVYLCFIGIAVFGLVVVGKAVYIQMAEGSYWRSKSDSLHTKLLPMLAERGTIYSENGEMLSTSVPYWDVYIDFKADGLIEKKGMRFNKYVDSLSTALAVYFNDKNAATYKKELQKGYRLQNRYYQLRKGISFEEYKAMRSFPLVNQGANKSGFKFELQTKRINPFGLLANRTIGLSRQYINDEGRMVSQNVGLEKTYDELLKGEKGQRLVRFISGGAFIPVEGTEIEPENGRDIITTIDVNIQDIAENALLKTMLANDAEHGTCIVMEVATGKIKAIANLGKVANGKYWEDYNYALRTTEPGSTIKLATLLAVLSEGKMDADDLVQVGTAGSDYVGVRTVTDAERSPKPVMSIKECFAHSSNVGMSRIAYAAFKDAPDKYISYLKKFHLDKKTGIDLIGEEPPLLPRVKRNNEGLHAMVTASFGYAIEVSPLQTLMLYNAIANNGKMMKPYLVNRIQSNGLLAQQFEPEILEEQLAPEQVIKAAKESMRMVATEGTAKKIFINAPYTVAGKTGTAHVAAKGVSYNDRVYQASFVGYFPYEKPMYTCVVVIKTKPFPVLHYGGDVAAPVFKEVADKLYGITAGGTAITAAGIKKDSVAFYYAGNTKEAKYVLSSLQLAYKDSAGASEWGSVYATQQQPVINKKTVLPNSMPNVKGMGLKDALYLLESMNIKVRVSGRGKVATQSVEAGVPLSKNMLVVLELS
jgi:cell division protein FtsI (penicillin-binding protein 3)